MALRYYILLLLYTCYLRGGVTLKKMAAYDWRRATVTGAQTWLTTVIKQQHMAAKKRRHDSKHQP